MKKLLFIASCALLVGCTTVRDSVPATEISGNLGGKPFRFVGPKDLAAEEISISAQPDGSVRVLVKNINAKTNPEIITTTGEAQAKITKAQGEAIVDALKAGASLVPK